MSRTSPAGTYRSFDAALGQFIIVISIVKIMRVVHLLYVHVEERDTLRMQRGSGGL